MIEQGLQQTGLEVAGLDAIAFSRGPGSFSGVRINAAVAQALAWSQDLPVVPVSTLQALAQAAYRLEGLEQVTAVLDARMNEVYIASFVLDEQGIMQCIDEEKLMSYEPAAAYAKHCLIGSAPSYFKLMQSIKQSPQLHKILLLLHVFMQCKSSGLMPNMLCQFIYVMMHGKIADQGKAK